MNNTSQNKTEIWRQGSLSGSGMKWNIVWNISFSTHRSFFYSGFWFVSIELSYVDVKMSRAFLIKSRLLRTFALFLLMTNLKPMESSTSVVRSLNSDGSSDVDRFSNPKCSTNGCSSVTGATGCASGDCCTCQCAYDNATYLIHAAECKPNQDMFASKWMNDEALS